MNIPKSFSEYEIKARYIPAILTAIPLILITSTQKEEVWLPLIKTSRWFLVVENISLSILIVFFLMQFLRFIAKFIFEKKIFKDGDLFPTTQMLLWDDHKLSQKMKKNIRNKVLADFNINLCNEEEEKADKQEAVREIKDAVSLIRQKIKKGHLTLQHNIEYGFARNLIAGTLIALPISLFNIYIFFKIHSMIGIIISILIAVLFFFIILFSKRILSLLAEKYAKQLFTEYLDKQGV